MASEITARLRLIHSYQTVAYHAKLLDFTNVKSVKFTFNPFQERVASVRFVVTDAIRYDVLT